MPPTSTPPPFRAWFAVAWLTYAAALDWIVHHWP